MEVVTDHNVTLLDYDCVAAATVLPKFLKFWAPPHDLALFINRKILELIGRVLNFE